MKKETTQKSSARTKKRRRYECFACWKRFRGPQALFGHRRHCPRLKQQAEAEPASQPVTSFRVGKRPGPLSMEARLLLLEGQDALESLQKTAGQFVIVANELGRMNVPGQDEKATFWAQAHQDIDDCLRDLDPMLPLFQLDRAALFQIYNKMRNLKYSWHEERACAIRLVETEDGLDPETRQTLRQEETHFAYILDHLRRLVAAAP